MAERDLEALGASLEAHLRDRLGQSCTLAAVTPASQGMSDDTLMVELRTADGRRGLVVRRYRAGGVVREETDPERHYRVLAAMRGTAIPVPPVLWYEPDPTILGGPFFVMERIEGHVPVPWSPAGRAFLANAGRGAIGEQFVRMLAEIHRIDWRARGLTFLDQPPSGTCYAGERVRKLTQRVHDYRDEPEPILEDALGWLRHHLPSTERIALVHGDYRTGNMIYRDDRIVGVLDWEFAALGDPDVDVAWVTTPCNRMGTDLACYLMPRDAFLARYAEAAGRVPDPASVRFWELFHQVFNAAIWLSAARSYAEHDIDDLRLVRWTYTLPTLRKLIAKQLEEE